jgi:hypothetical protein
MQFDKHLRHGARQAFVHGEALARPVAGSAQPLQLIDDDAAALGLPLPDPLEKFGAAKIAAAGLLALHQLPFHDHLGRDPRMIGAGLPQHVPATHPLEPAENVLQRVVERVPHMQRAGHVRRRDHDRKGFGVPALGTPGAERAAVLPEPGHAGFDIRGLVVLLDHGRAASSVKRARKPPPRAKSTAEVMRKAGATAIADRHRKVIGYRG